jgi:putative protease
MEEVEKKVLVGKVIHYYGKISVAVIKLTDTLKLGDEISIEGHTTNFRQKVESMQINKTPVQEAKAGDEIGLKVVEKTRPNDNVYKIVSE